MKYSSVILMVVATLFALPCRVNAAEPAVKLINYPASEDLRVSITLLKREGAVGKSTPFFTGYRPQFQFSGQRPEVTCAIQISKPKEQVEPGETADVVINCAEKFRVVEDRLGFTVSEGGRKVAEGALR